MEFNPLAFNLLHEGLETGFVPDFDIAENIVENGCNSQLDLSRNFRSLSPKKIPL
jgi:hypothetical protein